MSPITNALGMAPSHPSSPAVKPLNHKPSSAPAPLTASPWFKRLENPDNDLVGLLKDLSVMVPLEDKAKEKLAKSFHALEALRTLAEQTESITESIRKAQARAKEERLKQIKAILESLRLLISAADPQTAKRLAQRAAGLAKEVAKLVNDLRQLGVKASPGPALTPVTAPTAPQAGSAQDAVKIPIPGREGEQQCPSNTPQQGPADKTIAFQQLIQEIKRELALIASLARLKLQQEKDEKDRQELDQEVQSAKTALDEVSSQLMADALSSLTSDR